MVSLRILPSLLAHLKVLALLLVIINGHGLSTLTGSSLLTNNYSSLTGGLDYCVLNFIIMKVLTSVTKDTKTGVSTWDFVEKEDGTFAAIRREPQEKLVSDKADLRRLYQSYLKYGFTAVK